MGIVIFPPVMLVVVNLSLGADPGASGAGDEGTVGAAGMGATPPVVPMGVGETMGTGRLVDVRVVVVVVVLPPPTMAGTGLGALGFKDVGAGVGVTVGAGGFSPGYPGNSLTLFEAFSSSFLDFSSRSCNDVVRVVT